MNNFKLDIIIIKPMIIKCINIFSIDDFHCMKKEDLVNFHNATFLSILVYKRCIVVTVRVYLMIFNARY